MRLLFALTLAAAGCGSSAGPADQLAGQWVYSNADGSAGLGLTFRADGTYTIGILQATSATTLNAQIENGTYSATDTMVSFAPTEWSCTGPDASVTDAYSVSGDTMAIHNSSGLASFARDTSAPPSGIIITVGCFAPDGSFTAQPIAPVGP